MIAWLLESCQDCQNKSNICRLHNLFYQFANFTTKIVTITHPWSCIICSEKFYNKTINKRSTVAKRKFPSRENLPTFISACNSKQLEIYINVPGRITPLIYFGPIIILRFINLLILVHPVCLISTFAEPVKVRWGSWGGESSAISQLLCNIYPFRIQWSSCEEVINNNGHQFKVIHKNILFLSILFVFMDLYTKYFNNLTSIYTGIHTVW